MGKHFEEIKNLMLNKCNISDHEKNYYMEFAQNSVLTALATTTMIGIMKLPIEKYFLTRAQNKELKINYQSIRNAGFYTGYRVFVQANMPRSCYLIYSKNHNKCKEHDVNEHTQESNITNSDFHAEPKLLKWVSLGSYAAVETLFTHYPDQKTALAQLKLNYSNTLSNNLKLFNSCLGIRFFSSAINLFCLTNIQYEALKFISKEDKKQASLFDYLGSGIISGTISGITTYPLKQIQSQVTSKVNLVHHELSFPSPIQIAQINITKMLQEPIKKTLTSSANGMAMRTLQSCLIFCAILGVEHVLGKTPADDLKKFCSIQ